MKVVDLRPKRFENAALLFIIHFLWTTILKQFYKIIAITVTMHIAHSILML